MVGCNQLIGLDDEQQRLFGCVGCDGAHRSCDRSERRHYSPDRRQTSLLVVFDGIDGAVRSAIAIERGVGAVPIGTRRQTSSSDSHRHQYWRCRRRTSTHCAWRRRQPIAVRLGSAHCPPESICVSRTVRDHARNQPGLRFEKLGRLTLKNIARPVEAFVLHFDETAANEGVVAKAWRGVSRHIPAWRFRRIGRAALAAIVPSHRAARRLSVSAIATPIFPSSRKRHARRRAMPKRWTSCRC